MLGCEEAQALHVARGRRSVSDRPAPPTASFRERFLEAIFESATDYAIIALDLDGRVINWNAGAHRLLGWDEAEIIGQPAEIIFTEQDRRDGIPQKEMAAALAQGRSSDERWHRKKDGTFFWASGELMPLRERDGVVQGFIKILRDRTAQRQTELRLARSEERLNLALQAASMVGIWDGDLIAGKVFGDANFARIYGIDPELAALGAPLGHYVGFIHPDDAPAVQAHVERLYAGGEEFVHEHRIIRPDGTLRWLIARGRLARDDAGQPARFVGASVDITDRKLAEDRQRLLMEELAHRVKNTLTVVQAIVMQTLRGSGASPEARETLATRLLALSRAHDLLMQGSWSEASLQALVDNTATLHAHGEAGRFRTQGSDIMLGSRSAMSLALVLHELATNAVKYGALSVPEGHVLILWETVAVADQACLRFRWEEVGGPTVMPPARQGFGSRLIERSFGQSLGARIGLDYPETGVTFTLEAPIAMLQQQ
jgi:PAS domain S-box-containing protein